MIKKMCRFFESAAFLSLFAGTLMAGEIAASSTAQADAPHDGWHLVWSDEFNQPDGSAPDLTKWSYETGGSGWGNNEMEYYTSRTDNVRIENGKLVIEARSENFGGKKYTSGRLLTKNKWSWTYGRFEARIKIPRGQGIWPAFWMMGTNINSVNWPTCGEIDIMENIGREPSKVHGTAHGPGYSGDDGIGGPAMLPDGKAIADDFHVFAMECEPERITWFLDGRPYFSLTPARLPQNSRWVFNQPKFLLLNLAVGGGWPGYPDATSTFPQRMIVDYVRVYEKDTWSKK
jgi:beta-glucanase (GH16 family)